MPPGKERDDLIFRLWSEGLSTQEIGDEVGLTRQRVHQIVNGYYSHGGEADRVTSLPVEKHRRR